VGTVIDVTQRIARRPRRRGSSNVCGRREDGSRRAVRGRDRARLFNNVLSGILGTVETLVEETPAAAAQALCAEGGTAAAAAERRRADPRLQPQPERQAAPVKSWVWWARRSSASRLSSRANIRLEVSLPESPLVVIGDATQAAPGRDEPLSQCGSRP